MAEPAKRSPDALPILVLDPARRTVRYRGQELVLPPSAFRLLSLLATRPGQLVTKDEIYDHLWPESVGATDEARPYERQIADHKQKLIRKLRTLSGCSKGELDGLILTKAGKGYLLSLTAREILILPRSRKGA